jgi:rSAM/selenodomain-associated transferase 1
MATSADVLVVMAKYPSPGAVKTRLAERVGAAAAAGLYRAFLADLAQRLAQGPWQLVWAVAPAGADLTPFVGRRQRQIEQHGDDLGARMLGCFAQLIGEGAARVVMIGADAPHIGEGTLRDAFAALDELDAVFVPTRDGGYSLVGLRAAHDLFSAMPMGTARVFARTRARLVTLGLRWRALETSFDVDELADVAALARLIASGAVALPHTTAVLREWQAHGILPRP